MRPGALRAKRRVGFIPASAGASERMTYVRPSLSYYEPYLEWNFIPFTSVRSRVLPREGDPAWVSGSATRSGSDKTGRLGKIKCAYCGEVTMVSWEWFGDYGAKCRGCGLYHNPNGMTEVERDSYDADLGWQDTREQALEGRGV